MKANKKVNLSKNPVYIPNQPSQKGGGSRCWIDDNSEHYKEIGKEHSIHMKLAKRKGK